MPRPSVLPVDSITLRDFLRTRTAQQTRTCSAVTMYTTQGKPNNTPAVVSTAVENEPTLFACDGAAEIGTLEAKSAQEMDKTITHVLTGLSAAR